MAFDINEYLSRGAPQPEPEDPMFYVRKPEPSAAPAEAPVPQAIEAPIPQVAPPADPLRLPREVTAGPPDATGELPSKPIVTGDAPSPDSNVDLLSMIGKRTKQAEEDKKKFLAEYIKAKANDDIKQGYYESASPYTGLMLQAFTGVKPEFVKPGIETDALNSKYNTLSRMEAASREPEGAFVTAEALKDKQETIKRQKDPESTESEFARNLAEKMMPGVSKVSGDKKLSAAEIYTAFPKLEAFAASDARMRAIVAENENKREFRSNEAEKGRAFKAGENTIYVDPKTGEISTYRKHEGYQPMKVIVPESTKQSMSPPGPNGAQPVDTSIPIKGPTNEQRAALGLPPQENVSPVYAPPGTPKMTVIKPGNRDDVTRQLVLDFDKAVAGVQTENSMAAKSAAEVRRRAGQIERIASQGTTTPEGMTEMAVAAAALIGGSNRPAETTIRKITPSNWDTTVSRFREWFSSSPVALPKTDDKNAWVDWFTQLSRRESSGADKFLSEVGAKAVGTKGIQLKQHDPAAYDRAMKSKNLNPAAFDDNGLLKQGEDPRYYNDKDLDKPHKSTDHIYKRKSDGRRFWAPAGFSPGTKYELEG